MRLQLAGNLAFVAMTTAPADLSAPTVAELNAGHNMLGNSDEECLFELGDGWSPAPSDIATPDYCSEDTGSISGGRTFGQVRTRWYHSASGMPTRNFLTKGETYYVAIAVEGVTQGKPVAVYAVRCNLISNDYNAPGNGETWSCYWTVTSATDDGTIG